MGAPGKGLKGGEAERDSSSAEAGRVAGPEEREARPRCRRAARRSGAHTQSPQGHARTIRPVSPAAARPRPALSRLP